MGMYDVVLMRHLLGKIDAKDDQELEYCYDFNSRIISLFLEKYSSPHLVAIGLVMIYTLLGYNKTYKFPS